MVSHARCGAGLGLLIEMILRIEARDVVAPKLTHGRLGRPCIELPRRPSAARDPAGPATGLQKNASVRISMLSRGRASGAEVGSWNAVWAVQRARPSSRDS